MKEEGKEPARKEAREGRLDECTHCGSWNSVLVDCLRGHGMQLRTVPLKGEEAEVLSQTPVPC